MAVGAAAAVSLLRFSFPLRSGDRRDGEETNEVGTGPLWAFTWAGVLGPDDVIY